VIDKNTKNNNEGENHAPAYKQYSTDIQKKFQAQGGMEMVYGFSGWVYGGDKPARGNLSNIGYAIESAKIPHSVTFLPLESIRD